MKIQKTTKTPNQKNPTTGRGTMPQFYVDVFNERAKYIINKLNEMNNAEHRLAIDYTRFVPKSKSIRNIEGDIGLKYETSHSHSNKIICTTQNPHYKSELESKIKLRQIFKISQHNISKLIKRLSSIISKIEESDLHKIDKIIIQKAEDGGESITKILGYDDAVLATFFSWVNDISEFNEPLSGVSTHIIDENYYATLLNEDNDGISFYENNKVVVWTDEAREIINPYIVKSGDISKSGISLKRDGYLSQAPEIPNKAFGKIGVLDSGHINESLYNGIIKYHKAHDGDIDYEEAHGEAVSTTASFGNLINELEDESGTIFVDYFDVAGKGTLYQEVINNIEKVIYSNKEIKVWVLSLHNKEIINEAKGTSFIAQRLDVIQKLNDVRIIIAGSNDDNDGMGIEPMLAPSDSLRSITVNSIIYHGENYEAAPYTRKGFNTLLTMKPDISYFGGYKNWGNTMKVIVDGKVKKVQGTSFSAPLLARKYLRILEHTSSKSLLETDAIIINSAFKSKGNEKAEIIGAGPVPVKLSEILDYKKNEFRFVFNDKLDSKWMESFDLFIPTRDVGLKSEKIRKKIWVTLVTDPVIKGRNGVESIIGDLTFKFGRSQDRDNKTNTSIKNEKIYSPENDYEEISEGYATEISRISEGKWRIRINNMYDFERLGHSKGEKLVLSVTREHKEEEGKVEIPFTLIVNIEDTDKMNIYDDIMRLNTHLGFVDIDAVIDTEVEIST